MTDDRDPPQQALHAETHLAVCPAVEPRTPERSPQKPAQAAEEAFEAHKNGSGRSNGREPAAGVTLESLAAHFRLPVAELEEYGCRERPQKGKPPAVGIPYLDESGLTRAVRYRVGLLKKPDSDGRFRWRSGDKARYLYGAERLALAHKLGWVLIVEGESDCWACWHYGIPALGVPGKTNWQPSMATYLDGLDVYVWQEPGAEDLPARIARELPNIRVIAAPDGVKDVAQAHIDGLDVVALLDELRDQAPAYAEVERVQREAALPDLRCAAADVLGADDPLELYEEALAATYGGDVRAPLLVSLAATTRLLALRRGSMPCHMLIFGVASIGKSYTASVALDLLPEEAKHEIDAGSPRVLIYDDADLRHRLLVFAEADSLPAGEDNPAASAVRGLLQDNRLRYQVTVKDPQTGEPSVLDIDKPGPTAFLTTSTKPLGAQLKTRVFRLEVPDDHGQLCAALDKQAELEEDGQRPVPHYDALRAYQSYLQALAPWDVIVPFAKALSGHLKAQPLEQRVLRDFAKLMSLIKAVAVLRHTGRERNGSGRLLATIADYATVYELVADTYKASASGAGEKVRAAVDALKELLADGREHVSQAEIAKHLGLSKSVVSGRVRQGLRGGWLVNLETLPGRPARLKLGEPLPEEAGLPTPEHLAELFDRSRAFAAPANGQSDPYAGASSDRSGVRGSTAEDGEGGVLDTTPDAMPGNGDGAYDLLFEAAKRLVQEIGACTPFLLRKRLRLGPEDAERLDRELRAAGVVNAVGVPVEVHL